MPRKIIILFWLAVLSLSGCATTAKYEAGLDTFVGKSEDTLIASWGVPDKEYRLSDGKKALEYIRKDTLRSGGYAYAYPHPICNPDHSGAKIQISL